METKLAEKNLIYLYCVTPKEIKNLSGLYYIYYQGLYAIVSKVKESEFLEENLKKNLQDLEWVKEKATAHEKVIERIMKQACVIPFKLGTLFNNQDNLRAMLKEHLAEFKEALSHLEGKEEWGIKIYADLDKLKNTLLREEKELLNIDKEINDSSSGKAFLLKKKKEELIKDIINRRINEYGKSCFEELKGFAIDTRINKLLPKEVTERKDEMILNSAFLVEKDRVVAFVSAVDILKTQYENKGLFFDCTGPWPAYNFCSIGIKKAIQK